MEQHRAVLPLDLGEQGEGGRRRRDAQDLGTVHDGSPLAIGKPGRAIRAPAASAQKKPSALLL
jgi:hypothetical protein